MEGKSVGLTALRSTLMFTALISVTSWYRQVSRDPEKGPNLLLSGQDTASGALSSVLLPQHLTGF